MGKEKTVCEEEFEKWWVGNKFEDPSDGLTSKMLTRQNIRSVAHFAWNSAWSTCGRLVMEQFRREFAGHLGKARK